MKHLLTALIAAFFLVLPLRADEQPKHPSVRVIDHEGKPVEGLTLQLFWTTDGRDPSGVRISYPFEDHTARSNADGYAVFESLSADDVPQDSRVAIGVSDTAQTRNAESIGLEEEEIRAQHQENRRIYPWPSSVELRPSDLFTGEAEFASRRAVLRTIRVDRRETPSRPFVDVYQGRGCSRSASPYEYSHFDGFDIPLVQELKVWETVEEPAEVGVIYSQGTLQPSEVYVIALFEIIEAIDGPLTHTPFDSKRPDSRFNLTTKGTLELVSFARLQELPLAIYLLRTDGSCGYALWVPTGPDQNDRTPMLAPAGDYVVDIDIARQTKTKWVFSSMRGSFDYLWSSGSPFDTLLRLRRGEDLPHLKRITIPEGGTVELSSEDFLDPPAEAPAEPDPR